VWAFEQELSTPVVGVEPFNVEAKDADPLFIGVSASSNLNKTAGASF
jgi:hypothetical protein